MILEEHDWTISHKPGKEHTNADALSRRPHALDKVESSEDNSSQEEEVCNAIGFLAEPDWSREQLKESQMRDPIISQVLEIIGESRPPFRGKWRQGPKLRQVWRLWHQLAIEGDVLVRHVRASPAEGGEWKTLVVIPTERVPEVLEQLHNNSGHMGLEKTIDRVREKTWWPCYTRDTEEWIAKCPVCAKKRRPAPQPKAQVQSIPVGGPVEMWAMDFVGPLPLSESGNRYLLVMADYYTRWVEAIPLPDQRAETVARVILRDIVSSYDVPAVLHSDKGPNFESKLIKELANLLGIKKVKTTAYHPQCDGLVERLNQTILRMLSKHVAENQKDWDLWLPCVLLAYISAKQSSTGQSPFRLMYGREARLPADVAMGQPEEPVRLTTEFVANLERKQQLERELVETQVTASQERQVRNARTSADIVYEKGDYVWLHHAALSPGLSQKLGSPWRGPYRVLK